MSRGLADEEEEVSSSDDDLFDDDMEALRRACRLTGTDIDVATAAATASTSGRGVAESDSDSEIDDVEYVRSIQEKFSLQSIQSNKRMPLASGLFTSDDDEDDFETLRAIQKRFSAYDHSIIEKTKGASSSKLVEFDTSGIRETFEKESCSPTTTKTNACKDFEKNQENWFSTNLLDNNNETDTERPDDDVECHPPDAQMPSTKIVSFSNFPKCGQFFVGAIKKNRSCQKLLRSKLIQIEARIEEIKELKKRVQTLKDFQVSCRRRTGLALSQMKKDPRIQLITHDTHRKSKANEEAIAATSCGPSENAHVSNYRLALSKYPLSVYRKKWSEAENQNLRKGVTQQLQKMVIQISFDRCSTTDGDSGSLDDIMASIKDMEIPPETVREFLPKVNWNELASTHLTARSGSECEERWLNWVDPLINHAPWTTVEDKHLLFVIQEKGINEWFDTAISLGTNRTPFQCLVRYQRSLNPCVMKREWTKEEDSLLRFAVETFGEGKWQYVASTLEGRTGTQCSNRWFKSLHPQRQRMGRWTEDEDKRLAVAVMLFGSKSWRKICQLVPGRTHVQCRERWVNSLNPALKWDEWTAEEDAKLEAAIAEHGFCWSRVASCVPPRTDNQCLRRWKVLFPNDVPLLRAARKVQRAALIGNFVDRESERPLLGPEDFVPMQITYHQPDPESTKTSNNKAGKPRKRKQLEGGDDTVAVDECIQKNVQPKRRRVHADDNTGSCKDTPAKKVQPKRRKKGLEANNTDVEKLNEIDSSAPSQSGDGYLESAGTKAIPKRSASRRKPMENAANPKQGRNARRKPKENAANPKQGCSVRAKSKSGQKDSEERASSLPEVQRDSFFILEERSNEKDGGPGVATEKGALEETVACQEGSSQEKNDKSSDSNEPKERAVASEEEAEAGGSNNDDSSSSVGCQAKNKGVISSEEEAKRKEGCSSSSSKEVVDDVDGDCTLALFLDKLKKGRLPLLQCKKRRLHQLRNSQKLPSKPPF